MTTPEPTEAEAVSPRRVQYASAYQPAWIEDANGDLVMIEAPASDVNLTHILRCVNDHDKLVEALRETQRLRYYPQLLDDERTLEKIDRKVERALRRAEEGS